MRKEQLATLQNMLEQRKSELEEVIADSTKKFHEQTYPDLAGDSRVDFNHPADMVQADPDYEKELRLIERERTELSLVEQALSRLQAGRYGACASCEEEISYERLKAIPYTKYCIDCQERADRRSA